MINMNKILDYAIDKDASDIHLIPGNKPILRIFRKLDKSKWKEESRI